MDISPDSVSHKFVTKFSDVLFTKFGDLENSSPNLVINPSQNLTLNTSFLKYLYRLGEIHEDKKDEGSLGLEEVDQGALDCRSSN